MIKNKHISKIFILFLCVHAFLWVLIPSISNQNLPLDTIEALAWGSNLDWGYTKHPPLSAFLAEFFFQLFGAQDWAYYLLSQICLLASFIFVWKLSNEFLKNKVFSLISVLLLEGIFFYNFTSPEFNVNVCQLPFWSMAVYYCWRSIEYNKNFDWIIFGLVSALGFLSKYLFIYLLLSLSIFFIFKIINKKKFNIKYLIPIGIMFIILFPHFMWLKENNFSSIIYGLQRSGLNNASLVDHVLNPIFFFIKQVGVLLPSIIIFLFIVNKVKIKISIKDKKTFFLIVVNFLPLILIFLTSMLTGGKIRTMWMTPFYLFFGVMVVYLFKKEINLKKFNKFVSIFLFFFILSPSVYLYISLSQNNKRTDYPGKEIAYLVQEKWNKNFNNEINIIVGDEWAGGNLSYHLASRPKWFNDLKNNITDIKPESGFVYIGNPNILKKICPGVYGTIRPIGVCMIGRK